QDFASTSLLDIVMDSLMILGMLAVMFTLNWRFTLIALVMTPLLLVFVVRLRGVVRQATHDVRRRQSEIGSIVQEGLGSIRVVKAVGRGACGRGRRGRRRRGGGRAGRQARRVRARLGPVTTSMVAVGSAAGRWFGAREVLTGAMTAGSLVVCLTYLG